MQKARRFLFFNLVDELLQRKTVRSFAEKLAGLDELPPAPRAALQAFLDPLDLPEHILWAPAQSVRPGWKLRTWRLSWEITPNQYLLLCRSQLLVVSSPYRSEQGGNEAAPEVMRIPLEDILYLESGFILLTAWFECAWVRDGQLKTTRVHFNTVSRGMFEDLCAQIRLKLANMSGDSLDSSSRHLEQISSFPYKFRSLIPRHLLLAGEAIRAAVFLPSIWERRAILFQRRTTPRRALLRTSTHLILCSESLDPGTAGEEQGLIARFLPLSRVQSVEQDCRSRNPELKIRLEAKGTGCWVSLPFEAGQEIRLRNVLENKDMINPDFNLRG